MRLFHPVWNCQILQELFDQLELLVQPLIMQNPQTLKPHYSCYFLRLRITLNNPQYQLS